MIFWLVLKLEISYNRVTIISWRNLVPFRGFVFGRLGITKHSCRVYTILGVSHHVNRSQPCPLGDYIILEYFRKTLLKNLLKIC